MDDQELQDELFCLKFENKAIADLYFRDEAERWVYTYMYEVTEKEHLERYNFAKKDSANKKVLDIACGCGYGGYLIANEGNAKEVIAIDLNSDSIRYGNHRFKHKNVKRFVGDAQEYIKDSEFDVIVSFETIEHLPKYEQFLKNMSVSLANGGKFYVSTPIVKKTTTVCKNPFHVIEWSFDDFQNLISKYFDVEEIYLQNVIFKQQKTFIGKLFSKKEKLKTISFEKFNNQCDFDRLKEGYQMLVCTKKQ